MAFDSIADAKTDVPFLTAAGKKGLRFTSSLSGTFEPMPSYTGGETDCPMAKVHYVVPFGENRHENITASEKIDITTLKNIFAGISYTGLCLYGMIGDDTIYNAGDAANNASNFTDVRIVSVSGNQVTVEGVNPKRLAFSATSLNPEWPLSTDPRIESETRYRRLPLLCQFEPRFPSVLWGKVIPHIESITYPASDAANTVQYTITLTCNVSNLKQPYDSALTYNGEYYARIRWYGIYPEDWPSPEATDSVEGHWFGRRKQITVGSIPANGLQPLYQSDDATGTRILLNGHLAGEDTVSARGGDGALHIWWINSNDELANIIGSEANALVTTTQTGAGTWATTLDLSGIKDDATWIRVDYFCQARSGDSPTIYMAGACANSRKDRTGSRSDAGGRYCAAAHVADKFDTYQAQCWQPDCSNFCLGFEGRGYQEGNMIGPKPADMRQKVWWGQLWTSNSWRLTQGLARFSTHRNFTLTRMDAPSFCEFLGAFSDSVPGGIFPRQTSWFSPKAGQYTTATETDSGVSTYGTTHEVLHGTFCSQEDFDADAGMDTAPEGFLPATVSGWRSQTDALGNDISAEWWSLYPPEGVPIGTTSLHEWSTGNIGELLRTRLVSDSEKFCIMLVPEAVDAELDTFVNSVTLGDAS